MGSRARLLAIALVISWQVVPGTLTADSVIFDNFGPNLTFGNDQFDYSGAHSGNGIGTLEQGFVFTNSGPSLPLTEVIVALALNSGGNSVVLTLYSDSGGLPGSALESLATTGLPAEGNGSFQPTDLFSATHPVLLSGQQYWLIAGPGDPTTWGLWNGNGTGELGPDAFRSNGGS